MNTQIYTDGVTNVGLKKGMVRIEFGTLSVSEKDANGNPTVFNRCQLILTPQIFLETFGNMERMLQKLIDNGIVRERDQEERRDGPTRDADASIEAKDRRRKDTDRRRRNLETGGA